MLSVKVNSEKISKNLKNKGNKFELKKQSVFTKYSLLLETQIKNVTPKKTSTLVRSIHQKKFKDGFRIFTNLSYSKFVEDGTKHFKGRKFFERTFLRYKNKISEGIFNEIKNIL